MLKKSQAAIVCTCDRKKIFPGCLLRAQWCRLNAVLLQNVFDGRIAYVMAKIGEHALDAVVSGARILCCEFNNQLRNFLRNRWPAGTCSFKGLLPCNQLSVPAQQRIRRDEAANLQQSLVTKLLCLCSQSASLIIREAQAFPALHFFQHSNLQPREFQLLLLLAMHPRCQTGEYIVPGIRIHWFTT